MLARWASVPAILFAIVSITCSGADVKTLPAGSAAPSFTLQDQHGKAVSLADFRGKVVVLQWWNEGCPYVQRHANAGTFNTLAAKCREIGAVYLAINSTSGSNDSSNGKAAEQFKLSYPILNDSLGVVGKSYGAKTTPHMFVIDKSGNIAYSGAIDDDPDGTNPGRTNYVAKALDNLFAGSAVATPETKPYGCAVKYAR